MKIRLPRFRSAHHTTADWLVARVPGMTALEALCTSSPATNFGKEDIVPPLPLILFVGNRIVEAQASQSTFTLDAYSSHSVVSYAAISLHATYNSSIDHTVLPHWQHFAEFFDLVSHGPHVEVTLRLLRDWLYTLSNDDISQLKVSVRNALRNNLPHVQRFYDFFDAFSKIHVLSDIVEGIPKGEPVVQVTDEVAQQLRGMQFRQVSKGPYMNSPIEGYILFRDNVTVDIECFEPTKHALDPRTARSPEAIVVNWSEQPVMMDES